MKKNIFSNYIKQFDFKTLFNELGWDNFDNKLPIAVGEEAFLLEGVVEKRGFVIFKCLPDKVGKIPTSNIRKQIENRLAKFHFEHLVIYNDANNNHQIWQLAIKEEGKPKRVREVSWYKHQDTEVLFQRLKGLLFTLDEEEQITLVDVKHRVSENFAKNTEQVTKKFYTEFKKQHIAFLQFIEGIEDTIPAKENTNKQWYASLMLNRLMFCYFIQKKGFLDQNRNYLHDKLRESENKTGNDNFYSFYRSFLLELFHEGLGKPERKRELDVELGRIPYLNGGLFDVHELEQQFDKIHINDDAFVKIFNFFDQWNWHLDNSIEATGRDINPDVIGYIFEKYINDRASMGAYYTKEDITDYIGKNTIIPFLFDETERHYKEAFRPTPPLTKGEVARSAGGVPPLSSPWGGAGGGGGTKGTSGIPSLSELEGEVWQFLKNSGDTYIYDAVKKGVPREGNLFDDLPEEVKAGFLPGLENELVQEDTSEHLWEIRKPWNQKAPQEIALPTEIYRELIERRKRYAEIKGKIENGEITHINDLITYNLNIRQFTQDLIENTQDPRFIRHFYKAIKKVTILDPTCGSGAFLFAALNILEPLYEACITRMEQFVAEEPRKHKFFEDTLAEANAENHPNLQYYIFKNIILNNLYGVDIMKEAVEIAKLRLFLKLVATVDLNPRRENFGLEPLPDIDFNIRSGNTLIGFATENQLLQTIQKKEPLFAQEKLDTFKEEFELVSKAYSHFQNAQLIDDQGSHSFKQAKAELNTRLKELNHKLNVYLATNYGIDAEANPAAFENWLTTHQPFHWFAEFYQILAGNGGHARPESNGGGFDVIIGNPPYVQLRKVSYSFNPNQFDTLAGKNLYSLVLERLKYLSSIDTYTGQIIPISICSGKRFKPMIKRINSTKSWMSTFSNRPGKLFDGVEQRLSVYVQKNTKGKPYHSKYHHWYQNERISLFENIFYEEAVIIENIPQKSGNIKHNSILHKISPFQLMPNIYGNSACTWFHDGPTYWVRSLPFEPKGNASDKSSHYHTIAGKSIDHSAMITSVLTSSIFYLYYKSHSNCRDFNSASIDNFRIPRNIESEFNPLIKAYDLLLTETAERKSRKYESGYIEYNEYYPAQAKDVIDQIDTVLAQHYGFTEEELDFIINYDIKYRMGKALYGEENGEDE